MNKNKKHILPIIIIVAIVGSLLVVSSIVPTLIKLLQKPSQEENFPQDGGMFVGSVKYKITFTDHTDLYKPSGPDENFTNRVVTTYEEYTTYFSKLEEGYMFTEKDFENNNYFIFRITQKMCAPGTFTINNIKMGQEDGNKLDELYIYISLVSEVCDYDCQLIGSDRNYYAVKLNKNITEVKKFSYDFYQRQTHECDGVWKPMIYLYPEKDMNVSVTLGNKELLTTTYPKYNNGWNVYAKTNGDLLLNGRTYYGLYWEGNNHKVEVKEDGFVVKGEDTAKFLEEKLAVLGLTEREANEFIVYWLPKMEHNKYNYIRFETKEEIDKYMPMEVSPKPDTVIRVYMSFKPLNEEINVKEQQLTKVNRKGFTVVEWGGSIIK